MELWEVWNQPCLSNIIFLQSVDTLRDSTERVHLHLHSAPNQIIGDSSCLLPFGNKTMRQQTTAMLNRRHEDGVFLGIVWAFILNEAQWLNFASLIAWKTDTSSPLDFLLCAVADESRAGITQLQHPHLQIQGWQGSSASFNYEWQPFISCLLISWVDAIALITFSSLFLFSMIPPSSILKGNA